MSDYWSEVSRLLGPGADETPWQKLLREDLEARMRQTSYVGFIGGDEAWQSIIGLTRLCLAIAACPTIVWAAQQFARGAPGGLLDPM